jgi:DNA-binding Xre family transcriptional regulator
MFSAEKEILMPIISRVPELVAKKFADDEINLKQLERETGLTYSTVSRWMKNQVDRADFPILEVWCKYLNCTVGDLLVYTPDRSSDA